MLCYRDKTFCVSPCANKSCRLKVTDKLKKEARRAGLPLAMADMRDGCRWFVPKKGGAA